MLDAPDGASTPDDSDAVRPASAEAPSPVTEDVLAAVLGEGVTAHLQPVVDLTRARIVGYESLARFPGRSGPLPWFRAARELGLAAELEVAALKAALDHRESLPANTFLSINVSPDLLHHRLLRRELAAHASLGGVVVELTEDTRIESYSMLEEPLRELRDAGATIAVDDAGAGYAGLRHLLHLRPDFVKLDRDIVAGLDRDEAKRAMVEMMGTLAGRLDAWVIAEGVETTAELAVLIDLGVPLAQGYLLGRPDAAFAGLDPEVASSIRARAVPHGGSSLRPLVEWAPTATGRKQAEEVAVPGHEPVVVLDAAGRPLGTVRPDRCWWPMHGGALGANLDAEVADVAARAMTREPALRFDPVVCTDDAGRYVGVVHVERMVDALVRS